jgi:aldose 1-epimerase
MRARTLAGVATGPFLALALGAAAAGSGAPQVQDWGRTQDGAAVQKVALRNALGMQVDYVDFGATLTAIVVPDRHGRRLNVVLSLPTLAAYEANRRRYGAVIGRYAGRIGAARFTLDGRVVRLQANARGVYLHADPDGYDKRVWRRHDFSEAASLGSVYEMDSPAGDQRFPGRLCLRVTYRLMRQRNEFRIEYAATTDAPTVLNPTNHAFFNLAGAGAHGLEQHRFRIAADRYAVTDALRIPTGELAPVRGTILDFTRPASVTARLAGGDPLLGQPAGFDHSLLFAHADGQLRPVLRVDEQASGRRLEISTTEPSAQFNSGNGFDGDEVGSEGLAYRRHDGFAFETQHLPDSPNHAGFPSTRLDPGQVFRSTTVYRFSALADRSAIASRGISAP